MNKIIGSFLDIHKKEYGIESLGTEDAFEHFVNKCIINKYSKRSTGHQGNWGNL